MVGVKIPQFVKPSKPCSIRVSLSLSVSVSLLSDSLFLSLFNHACHRLFLPLSFPIAEMLPYFSLFSFATDLSRMVAARWWREGCGLWVRWVMGFMAWVSAGLWGGPMVVARWWHGYGSWLGGQTLNIKSSSHSLILSALGFHK